MTKCASRAVPCVIFLLWLVSFASAQSPAPATPQVVAPAAALYSNPVLAGDYPDPSIIRVGEDYWASATSSEWAPIFPLLHSRDLVNWNVVGAVFENRPEWAESNFWAPEISEYKGRYFVFYTARRTAGPLCVASASADKPEGPYTDHGPLVCEDAGSIDGFSIDDENGQRYLIWKYDGNSRNLPTIIWAQPLSEDGTKLEGEKKELIRNDAPWERHVVEGPFVLRRGDYFYMFYSGNACCGLQCNYALGVARSRSLLGPWEKYAQNPIVRNDDEWRCPGHGSVVTDPLGRTFLMYHAYNRRGAVYVGREAVLDEVLWTADGWPEVKRRGVSVSSAAPLGISEKNAEYSVEDRFTDAVLNPMWQWPHVEPPQTTTGNGLTLAPSGAVEHPLAAVIARATVSPDYTAETEVLAPADGMAGLSAFGDRGNAIGVGVRAGRIVLWQRREGKMRTLATRIAPKTGPVRLRVRAQAGHTMVFSFSRNGGKTWISLGGPLNAMFLPPWDRSIRVALYSGGSSVPATFKYFRMRRTAPRRTVRRAPTT